MKTEQTARLTHTEKSFRVKKMTIMAIMTAIAYLITFFVHIPMFGFLTLDFKDAILVFGAFIFGPLAGLAMTVVCSLIELVTIGSTGWIGLIMNILASASFVCAAALIHKRKPCLKNALIGLVAGTVAMTVVMIIWNYLITPLYMGIPREAVVQMLIPTFLPFNLFKGALNASLGVMLYPTAAVLEKSNLIPKIEKTETSRKGLNIGIIIVAAVVLAACVCYILVK
ncbi:MAG: ECF transporter S component [Acutalibacteraceae bacterium]